MSVLSNISEIHERIMFKQIEYFETILSKYQCCFRKGFSAQHCLLAKSVVDSKKTFGALSLIFQGLLTACPMAL